MQIDLKGLRALVTGSTAGIGAAIAARLAQNGAEVIINGRTAERVTKAIASLQAKAPGAIHYSEGVGGFIDNLARDQGKSVSDIEQGFFKHARPTSLLKRFINPDEVADVVAFVCSREAAAITGAPIRVDGGVVLSIT